MLNSSMILTRKIARAHLTESLLISRNVHRLGQLQRTDVFSSVSLAKMGHCNGCFRPPAFGQSRTYSHEARYRYFRARNPYLGTHGLIAASVTVFGLYYISQRKGMYVANSPSALIPSRSFWDNHFFTSYNAIRQGHWHTLPLSMFMHDDFNHLLFNMVTLYFFGRQVEALTSLSSYLALYFSSGILAASGQILANKAYLPYSHYSGSSGSVCALLSFVTLYAPFQTVYLYALLPVPMWMLMLGIIGANSWMMSSQGQFTKSTYTGHAVGFVCGALYYFLRSWCKDGVLPCAGWSA